MIDQDIKKFLLRRLLQKNGEPLTATEMKLAIRSAFVATLTEGELDNYITQMADDNLITLGKDDFGSVIADLTPKGRNTAQRLIKLS